MTLPCATEKRTVRGGRRRRRGRRRSIRFFLLFFVFFVFSLQLHNRSSHESIHLRGRFRRVVKSRAKLGFGARRRQHPLLLCLLCLHSSSYSSSSLVVYLVPIGIIIDAKNITSRRQETLDEQLRDRNRHPRFRGNVYEEKYPIGRTRGGRIGAPHWWCCACFCAAQF